MMRKRRGFTLVEMLVAMALSLIIILAVTQVFRLVGDNVLAGRACWRCRVSCDRRPTSCSGTWAG